MVTIINKIFLVSLYFLLLFSVGFSQVNILNATDPSQIGIDKQTELDKKNDAILKYSYVLDRDILWSKTVWETIDLDEKINQYLYYPTDTVFVGPDKRSLFDVLLKNIRLGNITKVYSDSYFNEKIDYEDIEVSLSDIDTLDMGYDQINSGESLSPEYIIKRTLSSYDIQQFRLKGIWFFDKRYSVLKYRLLGIAPISRDVNFKDDPNAPLVELFWVWYPDARQALHRAKVFNSKNGFDLISFDKILSTRRFSSVIYKYENIQNDIAIKDYIRDNAYLQLLEAEKVKEEIRSKEDDMWSY